MYPMRGIAVLLYAEARQAATRIILRAVPCVN
jgi:hypothetical protein